MEAGTVVSHRGVEGRSSWGRRVSGGARKGDSVWGGRGPTGGGARAQRSGPKERLGKEGGEEGKAGGI